MTIQQAIDQALRLHQAGQLQQAEALYRQVLQQRPDHPDALHMLGLLAHQAGRNDLAVELIGRAIELRPDYAAAHSNLAMALAAQGKLDEAIAHYERSLRIKPAPLTLHNLGLALQAAGRLDEAEECYRQVIAALPGHADAWCGLAAIAARQERLPQAIECYRKALELRPGDAMLYHNLGMMLDAAQEIDQAIASYEQAVAMQPDFVEAWSSLGHVFKRQGRPDRAVECYRKAAELRPDDAALHSSILYALQFHPATDAAGLRAEQQRWEERHARPLFPQIGAHANDRSPDRRLRIGYLSAHLCMPTVGRLFEPLLTHHDREEFEVVCYSSVHRPDELTTRLKIKSDLWRDVAQVGDEAVADLIRQDRIDILVDLSVHSPRNRLLVFARKPAPIQVTYLGYAGSTGLSTVDYRLTDVHLSPPGQEPEGPEKLVYLPDCYWCYAEPSAPAVNEQPALATGHITFGSFNDFAKIGAQVIATWSDILNAVPNAQLRILLPGGSRNTHVWEAFARHGVTPDRVMLVEQQTYEKYWQAYAQVDIALDSYPYNGGVTTLDSLWMGVPVVTLAGKRAVSRSGLTILSNLNLPDLIAHTPRQYIQIATTLAADLSRLQQLRRSLRDAMRRSPVMDAPRFAHAVEEAYRRMWVAWCGG